MVRSVGAIGWLRRLWRLLGGPARYRRIGRHLSEDGTTSPEDRALSGVRLPWPTRSLYHEGYLALLRVECIGAQVCGVLPAPRPLANSTVTQRSAQPYGRTRYRAWTLLLPSTHPCPQIGLVQLVHGVNPENPQTRRQDTLRGSH